MRYHCFCLIVSKEELSTSAPSLSASPLPLDTSHAYTLQAVSMNPADDPYNRKSHNHSHRYAQWKNTHLFILSSALAVGSKHFLIPDFSKNRTQIIQTLG